MHTSWLKLQKIHQELETLFQQIIRGARTQKEYLSNWIISLVVLQSDPLYAGKCGDWRSFIRCSFDV